MLNVLPFMLSQDLLTSIREKEDFLIQVCAVSDRTEKRAKVLLRRLERLAKISRHNFSGLVQEWRRRYICGWGSQEIREAVLMHRFDFYWY